jgi:polar amino acid transport system substrate-binding protein
MAARARRIITPALILVLNVWVWALASLIFTHYRPARPQPLPPPVELFPAGELRVGIDASFPPFGVFNGEDFDGLDADIARELGRRLGLPVRFVNLGYDGLYDALRVDQVDVVISALLVDPLRLGDVHYSVPYFNAGLVLVSAEGSPFDSMATLPGHAVAVQFGSLGDAEARRWLRRVQPFEVRPYELSEYALDAVRLGMADAALVDAITARLYLRQHPQWRAQTTYILDNYFAAATRRDQGRKWLAINDTLGMMIEEGVIARLVAKWL